MIESIKSIGVSNSDLIQHKSSLKFANQELKVSADVKGNEQGNFDTKETMNKELEKINKQYSSLNHSLRMKFNDEAEQFYVEIVDKATNEVIDSIPGEHILELAAKLKEMVGFFLDEKL